MPPLPAGRSRPTRPGCTAPDLRKRSGAYACAAAGTKLGRERRTQAAALTARLPGHDDG